MLETMCRRYETGILVVSVQMALWLSMMNRCEMCVVCHFCRSPGEIFVIVVVRVLLCCFRSAAAVTRADDILGVFQCRSGLPKSQRMGSAMRRTDERQSAFLDGKGNFLEIQVSRTGRAVRFGAQERIGR